MEIDKDKILKRLAPKKKRQSERGDLLVYFAEKLGVSVGRVAGKVAHLKLPDLYYLKSTCEQEGKRGTPFGKVFWGSLKIK